MWSVARRPRWIAALLLALGIASAFAALGHWQLDRSVQSAVADTRPTEKVIPLSRVADPGSGVSTNSIGQKVRVTGARVPGDLVVLSDRQNFGATGFWVTGHIVTDTGASLAVALGWAPTKQKADAAADALAAGAASTDWVGRYLVTEAPQQGDFEHGKLQYMSVANLINLWKTAPTAVYGGYLVAADAPPGLAVIDSPRPPDDVVVNWLNIFYAVEWAVFAGFAIYLWFRLVRDAWEREIDEAEQAAAAAASGAAPAASDSTSLTGAAN
jgi:surfeit locus 1 family protein